VDSELPFPDRDRISSLTALVLVTYTLIRIVTLPSIETEFNVLGLLIRLEFNTNSIMLSLAAALAAAGSDWLLRAHPKIEVSKPLPEHWVVPGLAAVGAGAILTRVPQGVVLWIGLLLTAVVLIAVLFAEFIVLDREDPRYDRAALALTSLAYLLLVGALFAIEAMALRAIYSIPLIMLASAAVSWRLQRLAGMGSGATAYTVAISGLTAQIAWGLHYWPIQPLRCALLLGLIVYLGNGIAMAHPTGELDRTRLLELSGVALLALLAIFLT
jgi:hypothetical protein